MFSNRYVTRTLGRVRPARARICRIHYLDRFVCVYVSGIYGGETYQRLYNGTVCTVDLLFSRLIIKLIEDFAISSISLSAGLINK